MEVVATGLPDILIMKPHVIADDRGFFIETFHQQRFNQAAGGDVRFVQDNHSRSAANVLRGLHYQLPPHAQGKLVRVTRGSVFDVAVDIRRSSATFGQWIGTELSEHNAHQLWIPAGFAHGFLVLSESADLLYKTTAHWAGTSERAIRWNDADLGIRWPLDGLPILSQRDGNAPPFAGADLFD